MKKSILIAFSLIGFAALCTSCNSSDINETRNLQINKVDVSSLADGNYTGKYSYGKSSYEVSVTIKDKKIENIDVLKNRDSKFAKKAEGVLNKIVAEQRNDVEVVSGATTTSKALLKAVENALSK